ncbi:hypothetical protein POM88_035218 [Heracleum sosnowskyi]|uniref:TF-B3 domain-containing protein n=1 Tax=Heracleum sosnowskyi TaxID=360622 RepID=A0AAD8HL28_9APIA|nr:hypothetical protein POM88_035218 [Heracleum sosnowskyi]
MVPIKFSDVHENDLSDRVFLKTPSGLVWPVDLERRVNRVWLQNGWPEFANHYSIRGEKVLLDDKYNLKKRNETVSLLVGRGQKTRALASAEAFRFQNPFSTYVVKPSLEVEDMALRGDVLAISINLNC